LQPIGCSVEAVATMIAFGWKPGFTQRLVFVVVVRLRMRR